MLIATPQNIGNIFVPILMGVLIQQIQALFLPRARAIMPIRPPLIRRSYFRSFDSQYQSSYHQNVLSTLQANTSKLLRSLDESLSRCGGGVDGRGQSVDIRELTIKETQNLFRSGALTSSQLTKCYLKRIEMMDVHLKSVIEVNPEALRIAEQADKDRVLRKPISQSPLHGIPVLIKDNIGTADEMQTTAGAVAMERLKPKRDAEVVQKLRAAGAIILGKTNPSEWAYFRSNEIPSGWSGRGGQTLSPYNLTSNPSGSSTGSAVAIGVNFALVALGSETDGSIISPSSKGSLIGLKTTIGSVSTRGVIPLAFSQDVIGPMARTVDDAAIMMMTIMNRQSPRRVYRTVENGEYAVGVLREFWTQNETLPIIPQLDASMKALKKTGLFRIVDLPETSSILTEVTFENELIVLRHEFKYSLNKYLRNEVIHMERSLGRKISSLADIIKFNKENPVSEGYNQTTLIEAEATDGITNATYKKARATNRKLSQKFLSQIMDDHKLDALAFPCDSENTSLNSLACMAGYPSIAVPVGVNESKMPFGICFLGRAHSDLVLLEIASLMELALSKTNGGGRSAPKFFV